MWCLKGRRPALQSLAHYWLTGWLQARNLNQVHHFKWAQSGHLVGGSVPCEVWGQSSGEAKPVQTRPSARAPGLECRSVAGSGWPRWSVTLKLLKLREPGKWLSPWQERQSHILAKRTAFRSQLCGFKSWIYHFWALVFSSVKYE